MKAVKGWEQKRCVVQECVGVCGGQDGASYMYNK